MLTIQVIGDSGSGKTTAARLIERELSKYGFRVNIEGEDENFEVSMPVIVTRALSLADSNPVVNLKMINKPRG